MQTLFTQYKDKTNGLNYLASQVEQRGQLLASLKARLDGSMQQALLGAEILDDTLILVAPSAAWATRLRFEAQKLLSSINNPNLRQCHINILTPSNDSKIENTTRMPEKPNSADLISLQILTDKLDAKDTLKASMTRLLQLVSRP